MIKIRQIASAIKHRFAKTSLKIHATYDKNCVSAVVMLGLNSRVVDAKEIVPMACNDTSRLS
jgi:hypothetical protein